MAKSKPKKKPASKKKEQVINAGQQIEINLSNVLPFIVQTIAKHDRDLDAIKKSVDAIGILLANHAIKKD